MNRSILVLSLVLAAGCSRDRTDPKQVEAGAKKPAPIAVRTAPAELLNVERAIDVTGSLLPDDTVPVSSEVAGRIARINYDFGQTVRKGDIIAELDKQEFLIQLDRSKAALSQALARAGLNSDQEDVIPRETPAIRQARAQFEDARSKYDSAKKLVESGDIARERFTELEKSLTARQAALDSSLDDLRTQLANIQSLKADKRLVEKRLADSTIRAPFDAQVSQRVAAPGQFIKENVAIMTLVKSWPLRLRLDVPENATAAVHVGDTLKFTAEAVPGKEFTATVREVNPGLESRSRSLAAEARLNQSDPRLMPGMFVQVKLTVTKAAPIVVAPSQAIYSIAGLTKLFVIRDNKAVELRIAPGQAIGNSIEIPGGAVSPGDRIAIDNLNNLFDGAEVRRP